jgi:hypothetical protein
MTKTKPAVEARSNLRRWTITKFTLETGISEAAVRGKIRDGHWVEGKHYFRRGRRIMLMVEPCLDWYQERGKKR